MKRTNSLSKAMAVIGMAMLSGPGHAETQDCELFCSPDFWKNPDTSSVIGTIVSNKEKINSFDLNGATPLHFAAGFGQDPEVIKMLIDSGAEISEQAWLDLAVLLEPESHGTNSDSFSTSGLFHESGTTPLHWAAGINKNPDVTMALLDAGADFSAKDYWERTPLHYAAAYNTSHDVIIALLDAGADLNAHDKDGGMTPLHMAAGYNTNPHAVITLLDAGAGINVRSKSGGTPLHSAAFSNTNPEVVLALLDAGADLNARDENGDTPLHRATSIYLNTDVIKALLVAGADVNARSGDAATPLHNAALSSIISTVSDNWNADAILLLLASGADPKAKDLEGRLPIDMVYVNSPFRDSEAYQRLLEATKKEDN